MKPTTINLYAAFVTLFLCISIVTSQPIQSMSDVETTIKDASVTIPEDSTELEKRQHHKQQSTRDSRKLAKKISNRASLKDDDSSSITKRGLSSCYKRATLTQYWIPKQGDKDMLNDGKIVTLNGSKTKSLKTTSGSSIAKVSKTTYEKFRMEGTGLLQNGVIVNLDDGDDTFMKLDRKKSPYGLGSDGNSLTPWVSVASNDLKYGSKLFIKELKGVKLPDGKVHNGCVRVDDEGWSFGGCQLDFFVLQFSAYQKLNDLIPEKVTVTENDSCKILNYVTPAVKEWAEM